MSIDGNELHHEEVRGKGTYRKALAGIRAARKAGFVDVEAITCVRPGNMEDLGTVEAKVRTAGANLWRLITIDCMGRLAGKQLQEMWLQPPDVKRLLSFITRRRRQQIRPVFGEVIDVFRAVKVHDIKRQIEPPELGAPHATPQASILATGQHILNELTRCRFGHLTLNQESLANLRCRSKQLKLC